MKRVVIEADGIVFEIAVSSKDTIEMTIDGANEIFLSQDTAKLMGIAFTAMAEDMEE